MAEYIERIAILGKLADRRAHTFPAKAMVHTDTVMQTAYKDIMSIPTADVAPVKHGRWVSDEGDVLFHCSVCETQISTSWDYDCDEMWNFCPHCGARMDGE